MIKIFNRQPFVPKTCNLLQDARERANDPGELINILHEAQNMLGYLPAEVQQVIADGRFSLSNLRCVGACGLTPVVLIGEKVYGRVVPGGRRHLI